MQLRDARYARKHACSHFANFLGLLALDCYNVESLLMKLQVRVLSLVACMFATGCSSGVQPAGPNTYFISKGSLPIWMSAAGAKADCYRQANEWCVARGLVMVPISSDAKDPIPGRAGSAELTFRALTPGDPDIKRNNIEEPQTKQRIQMR